MKVVPEWENLYPMGPVNELGEALSSGEQGKVMAAFEKIGCPLPSGSCSRSLRQAAIDLINLDKKYNLEKTALKQQQRGVTWNIWNIFGKKGKIF